MGEHDKQSEKKVTKHLPQTLCTVLNIFPRHLVHERVAMFQGHRPKNGEARRTESHITLSPERNRAFFTNTHGAHLQLLCHRDQNTGAPYYKTVSSYNVLSSSKTSSPTPEQTRQQHVRDEMLVLLQTPGNVLTFQQDRFSDAKIAFLRAFVGEFGKYDPEKYTFKIQLTSAQPEKHREIIIAYSDDKKCVCIGPRKAMTNSLLIEMKSKQHENWIREQLDKSTESSSKSKLQIIHEQRLENFNHYHQQHNISAKPSR